MNNDIIKPLSKIELEKALLDIGIEINSIKNESHTLGVKRFKLQNKLNELSDLYNWNHPKYISEKKAVLTEIELTGDEQTKYKKKLRLLNSKEKSIKHSLLELEENNTLEMIESEIEKEYKLKVKTLEGKIASIQGTLNDIIKPLNFYIAKINNQPDKLLDKIGNSEIWQSDIRLIYTTLKQIIGETK